MATAGDDATTPPDDPSGTGEPADPGGAEAAQRRILPPGWAAIDEALIAAHGRPADIHFGTRVAWRDGGPDPLDGIGAWRIDPGENDRFAPHWHIVSYGFTELYEKETPNEEVSGFGHELTMRVSRDDGDEQPPMWALSFLQNLARYVFKSGYPLGLHDYMNLHGPITGEGDTPIRAICLLPDPDLRDAVDGPFGRFGFLQIVGLTLDELDAIQYWSTEGVTALARERDPMLVMSLDRPSWLEETAFREAAAEGAQREGSSQGALMADFLAVETGEGEGRATITVSELVAEQIARLLHRRLGYGRDFIVIGRGMAVAIAPTTDDAPTGFRLADDGLPELHLPEEVASKMAESLTQGVGRYEWPDDLPGVTVAVEIPPEEPDEDDAGTAGEGGSDAAAGDGDAAGDDDGTDDTPPAGEADASSS